MPGQHYETGKEAEEEKKVAVTRFRCTGVSIAQVHPTTSILE